MSRVIHFEIHAVDVPRAVALEKFALPGMAWQGYYHDTENNVFGLHQPDPEAA
ncbi:hypothetical protein [Austwickia chelonae]|uniref:Glyoxalase n=1 Tax=Austwickia chelonae NBRC 105200 TaxID=1184607 RepID=K6VQ41_9MICO|nr:hypothetical protein [Austwickia chelonae]GAB78874.1 hypothetical protein AUCHE_17_00860 [Austwickia chelonae NBRC 105200]